MPTGVYIRTEEARQRLQKYGFSKGYTPWNKGKKTGKREPLSDEHKQKISKANTGKTPWNRGKPVPQIAGSNSPHWKGGITPENKRQRESLEYRLWRIAVFERDNYTCIWCGQLGGKLNADHIKRWADYPELRFAIDNGRTLCVPCHKKTDTFGRKLHREDMKSSIPSGPGDIPQNVVS